MKQAQLARMCQVAICRALSDPDFQELVGMSVLPAFGRCNQLTLEMLDRVNKQVKVECARMYRREAKRVCGFPEWTSAVG